MTDINLRYGILHSNIKDQPSAKVSLHTQHDINALAQSVQPDTRVKILEQVDKIPGPAFGGHPGSWTWYRVEVVDNPNLHGWVREDVIFLETESNQQYKLISGDQKVYLKTNPAIQISELKNPDASNLVVPIPSHTTIRLAEKPTEIQSHWRIKLVDPIKNSRDWYVYKDGVTIVNS